MRYWFDYLPKKASVNTLNRFEFTDEVLIQNTFKIIQMVQLEGFFKTYSMVLASFNTEK